jgi:hypothetical protein
MAWARNALKGTRSHYPARRLLSDDAINGGEVDRSGFESPETASWPAHTPLSEGLDNEIGDAKGHQSLHG